MRKTKANKAKTATAVSELHVLKNWVNGGGSGPQERPYSQILQVVQGGEQAIHYPRYFGVS